jgi:hypothetical protein
MVLQADSSQLRAAVLKIVSSPQRRAGFRKIAKDTYKEKKAPSGKALASLMVVRDVATRWNYTHAMIERAILLSKVCLISYFPFLEVTKFQAIDKWVIDRDDLAHLRLTTDDWRILQQVKDILNVCFTMNCRNLCITNFADFH